MQMNQLAFSAASVTVFLSLVGITGCSATDVGAAWRSALDRDCKRCASAKWDREHAPLELPRRGISYSFTGEFARSAEWWTINLDTGEIAEWKSETKAAGRETKITHHGIIGGQVLANVRTAAVTLWQSERPPLSSLMMSPGAEEHDDVISGPRLVPFQRYDQRYGNIVAAIRSVRVSH